MKYQSYCEFPDSSLVIDLRRRNIGTIIWATGFRPDHSWLEVPGGSLLRTRRASYIAGASHDTEALADHLHRHLSSASTRRRPASDCDAVAEPSTTTAAISLGPMR